MRIPFQLYPTGNTIYFLSSEEGGRKLIYLREVQHAFVKIPGGYPLETCSSCNNTFGALLGSMFISIYYVHGRNGATL